MRIVLLQIGGQLLFFVGFGRRGTLAHGYRQVNGERNGRWGCRVKGKVPLTFLINKLVRGEKRLKIKAKHGIHRSSFNRQKSDGKPHAGKKSDEREFYYYKNRQVIRNKGQDAAYCQIPKLLDRHAADEPKLESCDVLWDWMIVHDLKVKDLAWPQARKDR